MSLAEPARVAPTARRCPDKCPWVQHEANLAWERCTRADVPDRTSEAWGGPVSETKCDMCRETIRDGIRYRVDRHDDVGYYDTLDLCSAECLASLAVGEAHERGQREEHRAVRSKLSSAPKKTRKWWDR